MTDPRVIPLTVMQQRDVNALLGQKQRIMDQLQIMARTIITGADVDPDLLRDWQIDLSNPSVGVVLTPPNQSLALVENG